MHPAPVIFELPDASGDSRKMTHHDDCQLTVQVYRYIYLQVIIPSKLTSVQIQSLDSQQLGKYLSLNNCELLWNSSTLGLKLDILQLLSLTLGEMLNVLQQLGQTSNSLCTQCYKALAPCCTQCYMALAPCTLSVTRRHEAMMVTRCRRLVALSATRRRRLITLE